MTSLPWLVCLVLVVTAVRADSDEESAESSSSETSYVVVPPPGRHDPARGKRQQDQYSLYPILLTERLYGPDISALQGLGSLNTELDGSVRFLGPATRRIGVASIDPLGHSVAAGVTGGLGQGVATVGRGGLGHGVATGGLGYAVGSGAVGSGLVGTGVGLRRSLHRDLLRRRNYRRLLRNRGYGLRTGLLDGGLLGSRVPLGVGLRRRHFANRLNDIYYDGDLDDYDYDYYDGDFDYNSGEGLLQRRPLRRRFPLANNIGGFGHQLPSNVHVIRGGTFRPTSQHRDRVEFGKTKKTYLNQQGTARDYYGFRPSTKDYVNYRVGARSQHLLAGDKSKN